MDNEQLKKILTDYEIHLLNRENLTSSDFNFISLNTFLNLVEIQITEETSSENFNELESIFKQAMRQGPTSSPSIDEKENAVKNNFLRIADKNYHKASEQIPGWKWRFDDLWKEVKNAFRMSH